MTLAVRIASRADAWAIARIRVDTWREAYRGLIDQAVLDDLDAEREGQRRAERWSEFMADARSRQLIAELDGRPIGWAALGPARDPERAEQGELYAIYVMPERWSTGAGHSLMLSAEERLRDGGFESAHLWVLEGNDRAARFYERHGWREDGATKVDDGFVAVPLRERRRVRDLLERVGGGAARA